MNYEELMLLHVYAMEAAMEYQHAYEVCSQMEEATEAFDRAKEAFREALKAALDAHPH